MREIRNKITSITIPNDINGFFKDKNFKWSDIPDFAVITGVNGSGKTQLLKYIYSIIQTNQANDTITYTNERFAIHEVHYQAAYQQPSVNSRQVQSGTIESLKINKKEELKTLLNEFSSPNKPFHTATKDVHNKVIRLKDSQNQERVQYNAQQYSLVKKCVEFIHNENTTPIATDTQDETQTLAMFFSFNDSHIDEYIASYITDENTIASIRISELFLQYYNKIINLKSEAFDLGYCKDTNEANSFISAKLKKIFNIDKTPWDMINDTLKQYGFQHTVQAPNDSIYELSFHNGIKYDSLSDGEKVIFHLICSAYSGNGGVRSKTKFVVLDEFDAHLNPEMSKMFIDIVHNILVELFKIQVIMTTHSPSTAAYVPEENLFWMEKGNILQGDNKREKMQILHKLATGFVSDDSSCPFMSYLVDPTKPYYILVEGYTDTLHIKTACRKLGGDYEKILNKCNFINLGGTKDILKVFLENFSIDKKILVILDGDKSGYELFSGDCFGNVAIKGENYMRQKNNNCKCVILKPSNAKSYQKQYKRQIDGGYLPIELLYSKQKLDTFDANNENQFLRKCVDNGDASKFYHTFNTLKDVLSTDLFAVARDTKERKLKIKWVTEVKNHSRRYFIYFIPTLDLMLTAINGWDKSE